MSLNSFNRRITSNRCNQRQQTKYISLNYHNGNDLSVKIKDENPQTKDIDNFQMTLTSITNQLNNISMNSNPVFQQKNLNKNNRKSLKISNDIIDFENYKKVDKRSFIEKNTKFRNSMRQSNTEYKNDFYKIINENSIFIRGIEKIVYNEKELKEENQNLKEHIKFLLNQVKKYQKHGLSLEDNPQIENAKNEKEIMRINTYYKNEIQSITKKISLLETQYNTLKQAYNDLKIKYDNEQRKNSVKNNRNCNEPYYKENVAKLDDNIDLMNINYYNIRDNLNMSDIKNYTTPNNKYIKTGYANLKTSFNNNNFNYNHNPPTSVHNTNKSFFYNENGNNSVGNSLFFKRNSNRGEIINNKNKSYEKISRAKSINSIITNNKSVENFHKVSINNLINGNYNFENTITKKNKEKNGSKNINKCYIENYSKKRNSGTMYNLRNNLCKEIFTLSGEPNNPLPKINTPPFNLYHFPKINNFHISNENKLNIYKFNLIKMKFSNVSYQLNNDSTFDFDYNSTFNHSNDIFISISNGFILITGEKTNCAFYYNEDTNTIYDLIKLHHFHNKGSLLILNDNDLLCISGINSNDVELYSINNQNLEDFPRMNFPHSESSFLIYNKKIIFSFFGFDYTSNRYINEVEYLDYKNINCKNWKIIQLNDFNFNLRGQSIFFRNKKNINDEKIEIFIVGGYNELENNNGLILININEIEGNNGENKYGIKFKKFEENKGTNTNNNTDVNKPNKFVFNGGFYRYLDVDKNCFYSYNSDEKFNIHIIDNSTLKHSVYKNKLKNNI